ncbi:MAG: response regulator transcription factor [Burkholderiales bacterium]|jgi:two-component system response regulator QseB
MHILLIEDDPLIGEAIRAGLEQDGWRAAWVRNAAAATHALVDHGYTAAVLDLGLPDVDGLDWLRAVRARGERLPVIVASARDALADRLAALDTGADDFLVKPFDLDELSARLRAIARRSVGRSVDAIEHLGLVLDPVTRETTLRGCAIELSAREFAVLHALLERPGALRSRAALEQRVYGASGEVGSNAIEVHVHALRRKLGPESIVTVRGLGYRMGRP